MKKILILEDEKILAGLYKKSLERAKYEVECTSNVDESFKVIEKFSPDIVFVDYGVKGQTQTGMDFIKQAKKMYPKTKMIMLTNYSNIELQEEAKRAGAEDFLIKLNISPKMLVEYIERITS